MSEPTESEILQMASAILAERFRRRNRLITDAIRDGVRKSQQAHRILPLEHRVFGSPREMRQKRLERERLEREEAEDANPTK